MAGRSHFDSVHVPSDELITDAQGHWTGTSAYPRTTEPGTGMPEAPSFASDPEQQATFNELVEKMQATSDRVAWYKLADDLKDLLRETGNDASEEAVEDIVGLPPHRETAQDVANAQRVAAEVAVGKRQRRKKEPRVNVVGGTFHSHAEVAQMPRPAKEKAA
ncbi:MAG: hypothetical protein Q7K39_01965 [Candidatus Magasanikbacteria bacterium]|nr:hypothetical protein [Candidatus Magasanikbacteria bacterium]